MPHTPLEKSGCAVNDLPTGTEKKEAKKGLLSNVNLLKVGRPTCKGAKLIVGDHSIVYEEGTGQQNVYSKGGKKK